jgi:hypothetical protein
MVFHGGGGYDFHTIYNLPITIREFIFNKMYEKLNPKNKGETSWTDKETKEKIKSKQIKVPDYVVKSSSKF